MNGAFAMNIPAERDDPSCVHIGLKTKHPCRRCRIDTHLERGMVYVFEHQTYWCAYWTCAKCWQLNRLEMLV